MYRFRQLVEIWQNDQLHEKVLSTLDWKKHDKEWMINTKVKENHRKYKHYRYARDLGCHRLYIEAQLSREYKAKLQLHVSKYLQFLPRREL